VSTRRTKDAAALLASSTPHEATVSKSCDHDFEVDRLCGPAGRFEWPTFWRPTGQRTGSQVRNESSAARHACTSSAENSVPRAAAGLRREFSPARPPGLGRGHCALGLVDAVAHESSSGSPVQRYEGESPGEPTVLVASQRFWSRSTVVDRTVAFASGRSVVASLVVSRPQRGPHGPQGVQATE
jgi:hypothetical protein